MIRYVILGSSLLIGLLLIGRWFIGADPKRLAKALRWTAAILGAVVALYLLFSRQFGLAMMAMWFVVMLLGRFMRLRSMYQQFRNAIGPTPGQSSAVETEFLRMTLDHDSGAMDGEVLRGDCAGRRLSALSLVELLAVLRECRADDPESATVLEAYLDRTHAETWRQADADEGAPGDDGFAGKTMTEQQAYAILGLKPGASEQEVNQAHRRLMMKNHPDHGGSTYIAAKINQAKEILLGRS